jgi:signal transduction histidine kinase
MGRLRRKVDPEGEPQLIRNVRGKAMFSTSRVDPRGRATWRWGGAIAALLVAQSILLAGLFWLLATGSHQRAVERDFAHDCSQFVMLDGAQRSHELREMLTQDIHRKRFLALFNAENRVIEGNVSHLPDGASGDVPSFVATVSPTELPGKSSDVARLAMCVMPDGARLLTGVDLDDSEDALRIIGRSLLFGLIPGIALALGFGWMAGRRASKQVDTVRKLTEEIISGNFDRRLPIANRPDSFGLLSVHINQMLERLQTLVLDLRHVGDDIAHQLRTPLTRLRARIERGMREAENRNQFEDVAAISLEEIDKLLSIVTALLRVRELEAHSRRGGFGVVALDRLIEDACELHRPTAEDHGIALLCQIAPVPLIKGDPSLLMEAVSNLIDNAMKFGLAGGRVTVSVGLVEGFARVTVADDGEGIPLVERGSVTQRFYRGRRNMRVPGSGYLS